MTVPLGKKLIFFPYNPNKLRQKRVLSPSGQHQLFLVFLCVLMFSKENSFMTYMHKYK